VSRVASSAHGASGRTAAKSYAALPAEAKAACDAEVNRFVGPGKKYQTADAWRARYAEIYFEKD